MIDIINNGSHMAGDTPSTIDDLLNRLESHTLDWRHNCISVISNTTKLFRGNFMDVSHVFYIYTDEPDLIMKLETAMLKNRERADYHRTPLPT